MSAVRRARLADFSWVQLEGMRHRLVHGYDVINLDIVWQVALQKVGSFIAALEAAFTA